MDIKADDINNYKELCKHHFELELTDNEARIKLANLVTHMEIMYRPVTTDQLYQQVSKSIKEELENDKY